MADTVPKKIKINLNEEIELTEREEKIFKAGYQQGHIDGILFCLIIFVVMAVAYVIIIKYNL